ncbi:GtrA family protein [Thalassobaculum litoreum]|uniref:Flippase GtrA (Transmembrane translocase of bactoprenol-linked glucose) n=1 Tax=Thalassobaculum litoreum DSM 18839 TaxID=1123362 RepID=A0A8G2BGY8_9PROT|nr:GtrA family protein [Thalassobaculum litoreum]SDF64497.1 Putative flippase GtrA (transmembrane translocase of bactoprenol-linked glucose) [Thalassobaculum litoreum DSM 18839]
MARALVIGEFGRFLITGGIAAGANVLSRWLFNLVMPFEAAVAVAYLVGMTTAYVLAKLFVFETSGRTARDEFFRFAIVNVVALAQVWLVSVGLARYLFPALGFTWYADDVAHLIGVVIPAVTSYLGHRHFSFAARRASVEDVGSERDGI